MIYISILLVFLGCMLMLAVAVIAFVHDERAAAARGAKSTRRAEQDECLKAARTEVNALVASYGLPAPFRWHETKGPMHLSLHDGLDVNHVVPNATVEWKNEPLTTAGRMSMAEYSEWRNHFQQEMVKAHSLPPGVLSVSGKMSHAEAEALGERWLHTKAGMSKVDLFG